MSRCSSWILLPLAAVLLLPLAAGAAPVVLTFDSASDGSDMVHGEIVASQYAAQGISIQAVNDNSDPDLAVAFDTTLTTTRDNDLEGPPAQTWSGGNLAPDTVLGNVLVIHENNDIDGDGVLDPPDADGDGIVDHPDDEGRRPAGRIEFHFDQDVTELGFDIVDLESPTAEMGSIELFDDGVSIGEIDFMDFIDPTSAVFDATIAFGNNTANRIAPIEAALLGATSFDVAVFHVGGSGAFDNITVRPIPEPHSALLFAVGGLLVGGALRRSARR